MDSFVLVNGYVVTPSHVYKAAVVVKDGKFEKIVEDASSLGDLPTIDVSGKYLLPGLIDVHVHFRTPGATEKEDWTHGSKAALAGGVTSVLDMPNTDPPTTTQALLDDKRSLIKNNALVNYGLYAGATPDNVEEVAAMKGICGVKIYMGSSTGNLLVDDMRVVERFMKETDHLLVLHAENEACIQKHAYHYKDDSQPSVHSKIRDPKCAYKAVKDALHMAKKHQRDIHIAHVSTARELETIRKFKDDGKVSVEVTPHHLFFDESDYETYGNLLRVNPPVRSVEDVAALWKGIDDGIVDMIATDHAPHLLAEKEQPYAQAPSGLPGVQTMLPLLLDAVYKERLSLENLVKLTSYNPARRFGLVGKGSIEPGFDADFTVVDMDLTEKMSNKYVWSKCQWSPFNEWQLTGWPIMTFVAGVKMYEWRDWFCEVRGQELVFARGEGSMFQ